MVTDGPGGVDFEFGCASGVGGVLPKNNFGRRRPADISEANEEDAGRRLGSRHG